MNRAAASPAGASLATRAVRSGAAVSIGRVAQGLVGVATLAVLARLLPPAEFGVLAMVFPVALMTVQALNRGLHVAVLREERLTPEQAGVLFWIGQRFNLVLLGAFALAAPGLARLYDEPRVTPVALLWTVALALQAAASFPDALLKRQMRFAATTTVQLIGIVSGAIAAITAALAGFTHTALAIELVVWQGVRCAGLYTVARWSPGPPRLAQGRDDQAFLQRLVRFGTHLTSARAVTWLARQSDRIVVGYFSGAAALGLYDGARRWSWHPVQELYFAASDVAVAALGQARHDVRAFREYCRRGFAAFLALPLPIVAFVGVEADAVVRTLLGDQWLAAVPMVHILCVAAFVDSIARLTQWLHTAEGRTRDQLTWSLIHAVVLLAAVLPVAPRGMVAVAWAFAIATVGLAGPAIAFCTWRSRLTARDFARSVWRPAAAAALAALVWSLLKASLALPSAPALALAAALPVFAVIYGLAWISLPGGRVAAREAAQVLRALR